MGRSLKYFQPASWVKLTQGVPTIRFDKGLNDIKSTLTASNSQITITPKWGVAMAIDSGADLIDRIYEAAIFTDLWPDLLQDIADRAGARLGTIVTRAPDDLTILVSTSGRDIVQEFIDGGWGADTNYTAPLFVELWPGFRTETTYRTPEEIAGLPVHRDFLDPRGYFAGAGSVIQGVRDRALHVAFEGFPTHVAAAVAIEFLDALRPHLARSVSMTALRSDRSQLVVDSLALASAAAAVISSSGRLKSANELFIQRMGSRMTESTRGLRFADSLLMSRVSLALESYKHGQGRVQSIAVHDPANLPFAIHLLPVIGAARDACGSDGILMLIADAANASIPSADLLRLLFDLTPGEARVARLIASGKTVAEVAAFSNVGQDAVRAHLKGVFAKVGGNRQGDLIRLLGGLGAPEIIGK